MPAPIYIGGIQRSGTSLVRAIVGSHSDISVFQYDLQLWIKYFSIYRRRTFSKTTALEVFKVILGSEKYRQSESSRSISHFEKLLASVPKEHFKVADLFDLFLMDDALLHGKQLPALKTPFNEFFARDIFAHRPETRFIHVIRNPLDAAVSFERIKKDDWGGRISFHEHVWQWKRSVAIAKEMKSRFPNQYLIVRYEDVASDLVKAGHQFADFLDVDYEESMHSMTGHPGWSGSNSSFGNKQGGLSKHDYAAILSSDVLDLYGAELETEMNEFGYAVPAHKSSRISNRLKVELEGLRFQWMHSLMSSPLFPMLKEIK